MRFTFFKTDPTLIKVVAMGGCGLTIAQVNGIITQQTDDGYEFCYHTGYHGTGNIHYVYIREAGSSQVKGCSRVFITGPNQFTCSNDGQLKNKWVADAKNVVQHNQALFLQIAQSQ
jgi:hypothetical protein